MADKLSDKEIERRKQASLKSAPGRPTTKAEHAALKRVDKTVIKRMRKR